MAIIQIKNSCLLTVVGCLLLVACSKDNVCDTPFGTGGSFNLQFPEYASLQNVGGTIIIERDYYGYEVGYRGIFVRRASLGEFVAFDCTCPYCHDERLEPMEGWDGAVLECKVCESRYETEYGQPLEGAASGCPLYEYNTAFDGYTLNIY